MPFLEGLVCVRVVLMIDDRHDAAMGDVALDVFELDGGVRNVELVAKALLGFAKDGFTF